MPGFRRRRLPIVVAPVHEANRRGGEIAHIRIVEARDIDRAEITAEHVEMSMTECVHPTVTAENMVPDIGAELVVQQSVLAREQAKASGLMMTPQYRVLAQKEQLHLPVPAFRSMSASYRTWPQWQLPR
jgi:predicted transcriptional regulator